MYNEWCCLGVGSFANTNGDLEQQVGLEITVADQIQTK